MYLGIEIGGTKLQLGLGHGDGKIISLWRGTVDPSAGGDGIRKQILQALPELLTTAGIEQSHLKRVGIGFGGPVDDATRTVIKSHQIEGWDNFPLAKWIEDLVGCPAVLGNDADVAGLAEALFGAGKGLSPIFYITIGSGIGGGLIINGEIYRGCGRGAAEIGHLRWLNTFGPLDEPATVLEQTASGWGIEQVARKPWTYRQEGYLQLKALAGGDANRITARHVAEAAGLDNKAAWDILTESWTALAEGICHVIALLCPKRIIIGGGVSLMGEKLLFEPLRHIVASRVFKPFADCYDIVPAALGEQVVVHGALALAAKSTGY